MKILRSAMRHWRGCVFLVLAMLTNTISSWAQAPYQETYRPQFHFSPLTGWIGDPSGTLKYNGKYHLFWWGQATSTDLVHWTEKPFALNGGSNFGYFTGSVVVDNNNTGGFGSNKMIACYTMAHPNGIQNQGLSYSNDPTNTDFQMYSGNPVLDINSNDFRDPQVFWYAPTSRWIMALALGGQLKIAFYSSTNLKNWTKLSEFGPVGARQGTWECPDLFQAAVDGNAGNKKWVLTASTGPNKMQYFVGNFDGTTFTLDAGVANYLNNGTGMAGTVYQDFNGTSYSPWTATGTAFGSAPATGALGGQQVVSGFLGGKLVNSFNGGDAATGTLTSSPFTITQNNINFLIGGGNLPGSACINLIVGGTVVRTATGSNSEILRWNGWNVTPYMGQSATIQIVDNATGGWGHILVDHIMFSAELHAENLEHALWLDMGSDFYAGRSYRDLDNTSNLRIPYIAWAGNWEYANSVPLTWGQGFQTIPRDVALKTFTDGLRLTSLPIPELQQLRQSVVTISNRTLCGVTNLSEFTQTKNTYEIDATFTTTNPNKFGFNLLVGSGRQIVIGYDTRTQSVFVDRSNTTDASIPNFSKAMQYPVPPENNQIRLRILVDQSSVEIFTNSGRVPFTLTTFQAPSQLGIQTFSENCSGTVMNFQGWKLNSIWPSNPVPATDITPGLYKILSRSSGKVLDADGNINGNKAQQWDWLGGPNQKWNVTQVEPGYFTVTAQNGGKVLDASGTVNNSLLQIWDSWGGDNQRWAIKNAGSGYYTVRAKIGTRAMDVPSNSQTNGTQLQLYDYIQNNYQQQWNFIAQPSGGRRATDGELTLEGEIQEQQLTVHPNPTSDVFDVDLSQFFNAQDKGVMLQVLNTDGRSLNEQDVTGLKNVSISTQRLKMSPGIYIVRVRSAIRQKNVKVAVE